MKTKLLFVLLVSSLFIYGCNSDSDVNDVSESEKYRSSDCGELWVKDGEEVWRESGGTLVVGLIQASPNYEWISDKINDIFFGKYGISSSWLHLWYIELYSVPMDGGSYINIRSKITKFDFTTLEDVAVYYESDDYYTCSGEEIPSSSSTYKKLTNQKGDLLWKCLERL